MHLYWVQAALRVFQDFEQVLFNVLKHEVLQEKQGWAKGSIYQAVFTAETQSKPQSMA